MRTRMDVTVLCAVSLAAALADDAYGQVLVKDQQYRFCSGETGDECRAFCGDHGPACHKPPVGAQKEDTALVIRKRKYTMSFVEYQENGEPFEEAQFKVAQDLIESARRSSATGSERMGPATVFIYVHGWKNNASNKTADVERFQSYLETYYEYVKDGPKRPVVGIFLAWRGRSLDLPGWISWVSFWTRSHAARRVGNGMINDHIDRLVELSIRDRASLAAGRHPYVFVIGHSFGARVLETAVIGHRPSIISGACKVVAHDKSPVRATADVVLFENAATSAAYVRRQLHECQPCRDRRNGCKDFAKPDFSKSVIVRNWAFDRDACQKDPTMRKCQPYPVFLAVSAAQDYLTRFVLFVAALQHPAAFLPWRQTHRIVRATGQAVDPVKDEVFLFETPGNTKPGAAHLVVRKNTATISPANPAWIIEVGRDISSSHGDVWNATMMNMMINLAAADGYLHGPGAPLPLPPPLLTTAVAPAAAAAPAAAPPAAPPPPPTGTPLPAVQSTATQMVSQPPGMAELLKQRRAAAQERRKRK
ncbi:MAG: hypothetical protein NTZ56_02185 [Acidobacteria bacterium]|nr:hypothetical protein [Acidobacteriota bacterium]